MDIWVVAAAAGAGYLAKYWQNISRGKEELPEFVPGSPVAAKPESRPLVEQILDKTCPFRRLARKKRSEELPSLDIQNNNLSDGRFAGAGESDDLALPEVSYKSRFDGENYEPCRKIEEYNLLSLSKYPTGFPQYDECQDCGDGSRLNGDAACNTRERSRQEAGISRVFRRGGSSDRSRRSRLRFVKPLNSLESCTVAQMYSAEMDYMLACRPSPYSPTLRPFYVTEGSRIISKSSGDSFDVHFGYGRDGTRNRPLEANKVPYGIPPLPKIASGECFRGQIVNNGNGQIRKLSHSCNLVKEVQFYSQGSQNGAVLFCIGISVGVISSILADKMEMNNLREMLKHTENLVQDLQEELEMKDSLTVHELADENGSSQNANVSSPGDRKQTVSTKLDSKDIIKYADKGSDSQMAAENQESMTKIEAELEAELERLELTIKDSSLRGRLSDVFEIDQDFVAEVIQGDLRAETINRKAGSGSTSDEDSSRTVTQNSANYAVSAHDLSLRLHEVIRLRLEQRIMELEAALEKSNKRVQQLESDRWSSWKEFVHSESSSTQGSPVAIEAGSPVDQPLVMNLSGEAVDAYNEASEELAKVDEAKIDDTLDHDRLHEQSGTITVTLPSDDMEMESWLGNGVAQQSHEVTPNGKEKSDDEEDDDGMALLIKQIVEKTRQGSPAVFQAHRAMVSMEIEH